METKRIKKTKQKVRRKDEIRDLDRDNKRAFAGLIAILLLLLVIMGTTYAAFRYHKPGKNPNIVTTGTLVLVLDESKGEAITVNKAVPVLDEVGLIGDAYMFDLENKGTLSAHYRIRVIYNEDAIAKDDCGLKQLSFSKVKYSLLKNRNIGSPQLLSSVTEQVIDEGVLAPGEKNEYALRLWIDQNAGIEINGNHFHAVIRVDGVQEGRNDF